MGGAVSSIDMIYDIASSLPEFKNLGLDQQGEVCLQAKQLMEYDLEQEEGEYDSPARIRQCLVQLIAA